MTTCQTCTLHIKEHMQSHKTQTLCDIWEVWLDGYLFFNMWHQFKQTTQRSEWGHTLSAVLFLVQSLTPLTPYTELHSLPVCVHISSGEILLRKKMLQLQQKHCCIKHGDTTASMLKCIHLLIKDKLKQHKRNITVNWGEMVHSCTFVNRKRHTKGRVHTAVLFPL